MLRQMGGLMEDKIAGWVQHVTGYFFLRYAGDIRRINGRLLAKAVINIHLCIPSIHLSKTTLTPYPS